MTKTIEANPQDVIEGKTYRWVRIYVTSDDACWASPELALHWAVDQGLDPSKTTEESVFLFMNEGEDLRVYRPRLDQIHALGNHLEVQDYETKVRERALRKLSAEERRLLGLDVT